jgi:hypothetical protein
VDKHALLGYLAMLFIIHCCFCNVVDPPVSSPADDEFHLAEEKEAISLATGGRRSHWKSKRPSERHGMVILGSRR